MQLNGAVNVLCSASVLVNYGRGVNPIQPLNIQYASGINTFSDCSTREFLNVSECTRVAGVDCIGIYALC